MKIINTMLLLILINLISSKNYYSKKSDVIHINKKITPNLIFEYNNDSLTQIMDIIRISPSKISFKLSSINKTRIQSSFISGIAVLKSGDMESNVDENGNGYFVDEYIYDKKCWIAIRIEAENYSKLTISDNKCGKHNWFCPYASVGVLKRVASP